MASSAFSFPGLNNSSNSNPMFGGTTSMPSSNQFFTSMPSMPTNFLQMPNSSGSGSSSSPGQSSWNFNWNNPSQTNQNIGSRSLGSGIYSEPTAYPGVSSAWSQYVGSQVGQGVQANPLLQQLLSYYMGGQSNTPGASTLSTIANQGISALPEWQAMLGAQQQNIQQNQANLQEQFASMGDLAGSPFGTAMSNYMQQTTADQNSLLAQLQQQNIGTQIGVAQGLQSNANQMAQFGQTLMPQYNPMNQYAQQLSTTYSPMYSTKSSSLLSSLLPSLAGGLGGGLGALLGIL